MGTLRLVMADDHEVVRRGLRMLLEAQSGWEVIAEAADGKQALKEVLEMAPDVTILDIRMPSLNGLEVAREIIKSGSKTRILILSIDESDEMIREVLDAGARGYVLKTDAARDLVAAVQALRDNKTFFTSMVQEMILSGFLKKTGNPNKLPASRLTAGQREILKLLAEGKSSQEAAESLGISVKTVETQRTNMMRRVNCHSVSELIRYAIRNKIVEA
jgi:DNA-binding NarL/FixJ family response regulator